MTKTCIASTAMKTVMSFKPPVCDLMLLSLMSMVFSLSFVFVVVVFGFEIF